MWRAPSRSPRRSERRRGGYGPSARDLAPVMGTESAATVPVEPGWRTWLLPLPNDVLRLSSPALVSQGLGPAGSCSTEPSLPDPPLT